MPISDYLKSLRAHVGHALLLMPATAGIIFNEAGQVLLQRRSDNGLWGIPGGAIDPGETAAHCVVREVYEETGLTVKPEKLVAFVTHPNTYPNGDQVEMQITTFHCKILKGTLQSLDGESLELKFFDPQELPESEMLEHYPNVIFDLNYEGCYFAWEDSYLDVLE